MITIWKKLMHVALFLGALLGTATLIASVDAAPFSWLRSGRVGYSAGAFYTPNGTKVPIAEIANFLTGGGYMSGSGDEHPRGQLTPGLRVKQGYDRPRWDYFDEQGCILIEHNSTGFRDEEFQLEKPAGEFRVLAIGDSFTYGSGVLMEDAWPHVLERRLGESGRKVQVINCGFAAGYSPASYETWLESDGLLLEPDLVVIGFCLNDMGANNGNDVPMLSYKTVSTAGYSLALIDHFMTAWENREAKNHPPDFAAIVKERPKAWIATQAGLRNMKRILDEKQIPLVIAVIPMVSQLDRDPYPYEVLHVMINDFCRSNELLCVDTKSAFIGKNEVDLWVHPTDQHPNPEGQQMIGDGVFEFLEQQGLTGRAK